MHGVQIPMEEVDYATTEWRVKARDFQGIKKPTSHKEEFFGERNSKIFLLKINIIFNFQLQKAVQIGKVVDMLVDVLVQLCSEKKLPL